jgi:autotransporter-associated beta strand protein
VTVTTGIGSQTLTYTGATANNANVATANKYINAITLADGTNGGVATNYQLPSLDRANAPVTINAKTVTLSAEKTYDSNTSLTNYVTVTTGIGSQTLTYTGATANNANVATANKYINAITLADGTNGGVATNYQLPSLDRANAPVTINAKTVTLSAEKTYDSNTSLTNYVTVTTGVGSQTLTYTGATSNNANVASANKYINAITLANATDGSGGVATNYQLPTLDRANAPVTINAKTVTLSAEKTYDSNTSLTNYVTVTTGVGSQTLTYTGATSNNANVASVNKYINAITLANATDGSGGVATNYQLPTLDRANAPVTINAKTVTLSAEKTYDSNTSLTNYVTVTTGIGSQTLTYTGATANNANVATANKYINAITLADGTNGGVATNYQLPSLDRANAPVTINAKTVTLSAEKTYDSNTSLTNYVTVTTGIGSQTLTYTGATANNANVATANKYINAITLADGTNGGVATNYQLPSLDRANAPVTINAKTVTLSAEKTYDSNTSLTNYVTVTTGVGSQTLTYTGATSNNANVASVNKYINAITLANATDGSGGVATNYQLPTLDRANAPVTINAKTVTLSAEKTYDSNTSLTNYVTVTTGIGSQTLTYTGATANNANVATANKYINAITLANATDGSGGVATNYQLPTLDRANAPVTINAKTVTLSAEKTYDSNTSLTNYVTVTTGIGSQTLTYTGATANNANVATANKYINAITLADGTNGGVATNYQLPSLDRANAPVTINAKTVTLSAEKTYDSNTSLTNYVTVTTGVGSQTLTYTGATSNNANVASVNKYINAITLANATDGSGGVATNYQLPTLDRANAPVTINAKTVTLSAEKTYDSNTSLTNYVTVTTGIGSQTLTYTGATANNANVATANKYINAITLADGTNGGVATNYQLPSLDRANAPVTINAKTVTLSAEKTYDSNTSLTNYVTVTTGIGSQTLTYTGATANNANVASVNKYINAITLADGTNGGVATNYQLPSLDRANAPVTINAKTVTLSAEKTYDSNTSLTNYVTVTTGVGSQTLTYTGATSNNANVASANKYINAITLANATDGSGGVATNYQLPTLDRANAPVTINAKTVTLSAEKTYDSNTSLTNYVTVTTGVGSQTLTYTGATSNNANVASVNKYINAITLANATDGSGGVATNYQLPTLDRANAPVTINAKTVTLSAEKTYDSNTSLTNYVTVTTGIGSQTLTYTGATANNANVATANKYINAITLADGTNGGVATNYQLPSLDRANAPVTINAKTVTLSAEKTYDSNTSLTNYVTVTTGIGSQTLTYTGATANNANVATANKYINAITLADGTNGGVATNYQLPTLDRANAPVTINAKTATVTATKTYDSNTTLTKPQISITGVGGAVIDFDLGTAAANDANVATANKYVTLGTLALTGGSGATAASNYELPASSSSANNSVTINAKTATVTATKTYDSNTTLTKPQISITGVGGATIDFDLGTAAANDANVATANKYVTLGTLALTGGSGATAASNYELPASSSSANNSVTINAKTVTLSAEKTYDSNTSLTNYVTVTTGIGSQTLTYTGATANNANVATANKYINAITLADGTNGGVATNYQLPSLDRANAPVTINAKTVTLSAEKTYDSNTSLTNYVTVTTGIGSQTLTYTGATANNANVATANKYINVITLANATDGSGGVATNYQLPTLDRANAPVTINAKTVTLSAEKTYDSNTSLTNYVTVTTGVGSQTLTYTGATANNANVATANKYINAITLADGTNGGVATNYQLPSLDRANAPVTINAKALTITADARQTTYGTALVLGTTGFTQSGLETSVDSISGVTLKHGTNTTVPVTQFAGTYTDEIIASAATGTGLSNYNISYMPNTLTVNKYVISINAPSVTKAYDGLTSYTASSADLATIGSGLLNSDSITSATITYSNKNVSAGNKVVTLDAITLADGNGGNNYQVTRVGNSSSTITRQSSVTWIGGSTGEWFNPANWAVTGNLGVAGAVPDLSNVSAVVIGTGKTVTFNDSVAGITSPASTGAVNITTLSGGGSLSVTNGDLSATSLNVIQLNTSVGTSITTSTGITVATATGTSDTIAGVLAGNGSLTKNGSGKLILSGTNTYTGDTNINAGTLTLTGTLATATNVVMTNAAVWDLQASQTIASLTMASGNSITNTAGTSSLTVSGASTLANSITTTGTQVYSGAVTLGADVELSSSDSDITFASAITGSGKDLTVSTGNGDITLAAVGTTLAFLGDVVLNSSGATTLGGAVYATSLETDSSGTGSGTIAINGVLVQTTGTQTYRESITLGTDTTLAGSTINTGSTVAGGNNSLTITGNADVDGAITGVTNLSVSGTSNLGANVTTSGTQTYTGAVTLSGGDRTLTGTTINTGSTVAGGNNSLTITGNADVDGDITGVTNLSVSGTSNLGANVTTSGTQTYTGAVTLSGGDRTLTGTTINTGSTVAGGNNSLTITGNADVDGAITGVTNLSVSGTSNLGANVTTSATQTYTGAVTLSGGDRTLTGTTINTGSTVAGGNNSLTITGNADVDGDITGVTNLSVSGTSNLGANVTTSATQTYTGAVTLSGGDRTLTGTTINTGSTVAGGNNSLTITGNADVDGAITGVTNLSVSGTSNLGANVTTSGTQTYTGAVTLSGGDRTLTTTDSQITFSDIVNSAATQVRGLTLNAGISEVEFNGVVGGATDGGLGAIAITGNLDLNNTIASAVSLSVSGTSNLGANVTTSSTQTYTGAVTLSGGDRTLTGTTINTGSTVAGGNNSLTITGNADVDGAITGVTNLSVSGTSNLGANVTTSATQTYTGAVTLSGGDRTLTGTTINTGSTVAGGNNSLTITGNADVDGAITGVTNLSVSGTSNLGANVTTSGTQTYTGAVTLSGGDRTLTGTTINTGSTVAGGNNSLTITGNADMDGDITGVTNLSVSGTSNLGANVTTSGTQTYTGAVTLSGGDRTLTGTTINTGSTVAGGNNSLTITGHADIDGAITDLVDLSISGTSNLGADITSTGTQSYLGAVTISNNIELITTSGDINFASTVNGAKTLTLVTGNAGSVTVTGAVGGSAGLTGLNVTTDVLAANAINFANNGILDITITGDSVINGVISGTGISFDKSGVGTLTLNGNNTYGGITSINAGTLKLGHANALGSTATGSGTVVNANSTLDLNGLSITEPVTLNGGRFINGTLAGSMNLTADSILEASSGETEVEGIISGNFGLTITGNGTLTLSGNNTYTGLTNISSATLRITHANALGSASGSTTIASGATLDLVNVAVASENLVINGGTLKDATSSWGGNITLSGNTTFDITTGDDLTVHGVISGTGSLNKISGGFLIFTNTNTYTGSTTVTAGKLSLAVNNLTNTVGSIATSSQLVVDGIFDISGVASSSDIKRLFGNGSVVLGSKALNLTAANDTFSGVISGAGALTLAAGQQTLSRANTYSGITTITDGTLFLIGAGSIADSAKLVANGTFDISGASAAVTVKSLSGANAGSVNLGSKNLILTAANDDDFAGAIRGSGDVTLSAGTQTFSGANTYSGQTLVNAGTLVITHNTGLGATTAGTSIAAGATLDLQNVTVGAESINLAAGTLATTSGTSSLAGSINLSDDATIAVSGTQLTLSNEISGSGFGITKTGSGNLVLSGTNTYTGDTNINVGRLTLTGALASATDVVMRNQAIWDLQAEQTIASLTMDSGNSIENTTGMSSLIVSGASTLANSIRTSGTQDYNGITTLIAAVTLTATDNNISFIYGVLGSGQNLTISTGNGAITLETIGATDAYLGRVILNSLGATTIEGAVYASSLETDSSGTGSGSIAINGGLVRTTGNQTYRETLTLGANTTLHGQIINTASTVNGGGKSLTITGNADIDGDITGVTILSITGTSNLGANITTTGAQEYSGIATLSSDVTLSATDNRVRFINSILGSGQSLTISTGNGGISLKAIGATDAYLGRVVLNSFGATTLAGAVYALEPLQ